MRTHAIPPLAALLALAACQPDFTGPEQVQALRVLAVQAEPPEIGAAVDEGSHTGWPGDHAAIRALIGHPRFAADGGDHAVVLHLACTPTPGSPAGTVCTSLSALSQPSELFASLSLETACSAPGLGVEDAITFSGLESCNRSGCRSLAVQSDPADPGSVVDFGPSTYRLPAGFAFSGLDPANVQRVLGTDVVVLSLAIEGAPADLVPPAAVAATCDGMLPAVEAWFLQEWPLRPHVVSLKWIHARGGDMPDGSPPNHNPSIDNITFGGTALPEPGGTSLPVTAGESADLLPALPGDFETLRETYQRYDTDGKLVDTRKEDWAYSWFTTAGDLKDPVTHGWDDPDRFTPAHGTGLLWLVVRDLRGGEAWTAGQIAAH